MRNALWSGLLLTLSFLSLAACAGSNPYGYGREYVVRDDEETYYESALDISYEEVRREPQAFESRLLGWFGVVTAVEKLPGGETLVALELRFHQPRHLCTDQFESSCRVTISERAGGPFTTTLKLAAVDTKGADRLSPGCLVKIYGAPTGEFDARGGPVIKAQWYRQWPHGAYVTTSGIATMRR
jgi:hypothetical protein